MEWNCGLTLAGTATTIGFDAPTGDAYYLDPTQCSGLDGLGLRAPIDNRAATDGGILHQFLKPPRHLTLSGQLVVRTPGIDSVAVAARNVLERAFVALCEEIANADGTLSWTLTGGGSYSITVRCDLPVVFSGGLQKAFIVGLVAAVPTLTPA